MRYRPDERGPEPDSPAPTAPAVEHPEITWGFDDPAARWYEDVTRSDDWREVRGAVGEFSPAVRASILARQDSTIAPLEIADEWANGAPYDSVAASFRGWCRLHAIWREDRDTPGESSDLDDRGRNGEDPIPGAASQNGNDPSRSNDYQRAEDDFLRALSLDPDDVAARVGLIRSGGALGASGAVLTTRYEDVHEQVPFLPCAADALCRALARRRNTDIELMAAFAQMVAAEAPAGSPAIACLATAYLEHARLVESYRRLAQPYARMALKTAVRRSVALPDFRHDLEGRVALNLFAGAFWFGQHRADAIEMLELLGGWYCREPWCAIADPAEYVQWVEHRLARPKPWEHPLH